MIRSLLRPALVACALALSSVIACDDDPARPGPASDGADRGGSGGGGGGGGAADGGGGGETDAGEPDAAGSCSALDAADAPTVDQLAAVGDPPIGTGGPIEPGTYQLTSSQIFGSGGGGPTGFSNRGILVLGDLSSTMGDYERVIVTVSQTGTIVAETRESGAAVVSGSSLAFSASCPSVRQEQLSYTATGTTLILTNAATRESYTFTRR